MTNCPPSLRGDLSKWLCEINTGVYVGNVSSRVRDAIWDRVCENLKNGQATLVFNTNNEQRMDFRTHNTSWDPSRIRISSTLASRSSMFWSLGPWSGRRFV